MPFRRRRRRRRRARRPTAMRAVKRLARFVDTELNFSDQTTTNPDVDNDPLILPLVIVPQGDDANDRHGIQITLRRLHIRWIFQIGSESVCVRLMLVIDKQVNGVEFTIDELLQDTTTDLRSLVSPLNNDNRRRFTVLKDWHRTLVPGHSNTLCFSVHRKLSNKVRFLGTGALINDVTSGMPFLVMFTDKVTAATAPNVTVISRVWFAP